MLFFRDLYFGVKLHGLESGDFVLRFALLPPTGERSMGSVLAKICGRTGNPTSHSLLSAGRA
jgi:hypothetical protein